MHHSAIKTAVFTKSSNVLQSHLFYHRITSYKMRCCTDMGCHWAFTSLRWTGLYSGAVHVKFLLLKVALRRVFLLVFCVDPVVIIPPMVRIDILTDLPIQLSLCVCVCVCVCVWSGFGGLQVACWPLVPKFTGSHLVEAVGFLGRKNPQHAFLRRGSKAVGPMS